MAKNFPFLGYIALFSYFLPAVYGIRFWKALSSPMKFFAVFCITSLLFVLAEHSMAMLNIHNLRFGDFFLVIEFICLIYLFRKITVRQVVRDMLQIIGMGFILYWFLEMSFLTVSTQFQETVMIAEHLLFIAASILTLSEISENSEHSLFKHSMAWIAAGVLLYSAGTISVISMGNSLLKLGANNFTLMWNINWVMALLTNLFYSRSFTCKIF
ncbi:MAG: hypothetical protein H3C35_08280 [Bacteroidetes bacterium]|nr:hypothetical protein [Bacteroidota bacterium]